MLADALARGGGGVERLYGSSFSAGWWCRLKTVTGRHLPPSLELFSGPDCEVPFLETNGTFRAELGPGQMHFCVGEQKFKAGRIQAPALPLVSFGSRGGRRTETLLLTGG